jgi:hypothetical protein
VSCITNQKILSAFLCFVVVFFTCLYIQRAICIAWIHFHIPKEADYCCIQIMRLKTSKYI